MADDRQNQPSKPKRTKFVPAGQEKKKTTTFRPAQGAKTDRGSKTKRKKKATPTPVLGTDEGQETPEVEYFPPVPHKTVRMWVFGILCVLTLISPGETSGWSGRFAAMLMFAVMTGTYRISGVRKGRVETQMTVLYKPLKRHRWKLEHAEAIEVDYNEGDGIMTYIFFGPIYWVCSHLFCHALPILGGRFTILLRMTSGRRIRVWQGNSQSRYDENLLLLEHYAKVPVERAGGAYDAPEQFV